MDICTITLTNGDDIIVRGYLQANIYGTIEVIQSLWNNENNCKNSYCLLVLKRDEYVSFSAQKFETL